MRTRNLVNLLLIMASVSVVAVFAFSVRLEASADRVTVLKADGITCGSCAAGIKRALEKEKGVVSVAVEEAAGRVVVGYDSKAADPEALACRVASAGYGCRVLQVLAIEEYRAAGGDLPGRGARGCCCAKNKQ